MVLGYMDAVDTVSLSMLFKVLAAETVGRPEDADVIVADH